MVEHTSVTMFHCYSVLYDTSVSDSDQGMVRLAYLESSGHVNVLLHEATGHKLFTVNNIRTIRMNT